jgi:hypothetical protein
VFNPRAWLMVKCQACRRKFSTGIRMDTATRYGTRGWNVKCPYCGAKPAGEPEAGVATPVSASRHVSL